MEDKTNWWKSNLEDAINEGDIKNAVKAYMSLLQANCTIQFEAAEVSTWNSHLLIVPDSPTVSHQVDAFGYQNRIEDRSIVDETTSYQNESIPAVSHSIISEETKSITKTSHSSISEETKSIEKTGYKEAEEIQHKVKQIYRTMVLSIHESDDIIPTFSFDN